MFHQKNSDIMWPVSRCLPLALHSDKQNRGLTGEAIWRWATRRLIKWTKVMCLGRGPFPALDSGRRVEAAAPQAFQNHRVENDVHYRLGETLLICRQPHEAERENPPARLPAPLCAASCPWAHQQRVQCQTQWWKWNVKGHAPWRFRIL